MSVYLFYIAFIGLDFSERYILDLIWDLFTVDPFVVAGMLTAIGSLVLFSAGFVGFCCWKHPSLRTRTFWDKQTKKILRVLYSKSKFLSLAIVYIRNHFEAASVKRHCSEYSHTSELESYRNSRKALKSYWKEVKVPLIITSVLSVATSVFPSSTSVLLSSNLSIS